MIGYGSQGHAHALNLRDSGVEVRGRPAGEPAARASKARGRRADASTTSPRRRPGPTSIMLLTPDTAQPALYATRHRAATSTPGKMLMFAHGFNIRFGTITPPAGRRRHDGRAEVARPSRARAATSRAAARRRCSPSTRTRPARRARWRCRTRKGIGATRAGVIETTFAEETETDLFGEQAVLCGGVSALVKAGFETLVEAGYQPEIAYFECLHELKLIVDLMYRGGLNYMRYSVSDTAEHGDYTGGPRIITDETRADDAADARARSRTAPTREAWIAENEQGRPTLQRDTRARAGPAARAGRRRAARDDAVPEPGDGQARRRPV